MADDVDPRFDPAYQRGYDGEVTTQRRRPPLGVPSVTPAARVGAVPVAPAAPVAPAVAVEPAPTPAPSFAAPVAEEPADSPRARANPFLISLAVLGVVVLAGGAWLTQFVLEGVGEDFGSTQYYTLQFASFAAPIALGVGVLMIGGVLAILAARWRR